MTRDDAIFTMEYFKLHFAKREAVEAFDMAIKALEQEPKAEVLDKIRAEIEGAIQEEIVEDHSGSLCNYDYVESKLDPDDVFQIIDKYKAESEEQE